MKSQGCGHHTSSCRAWAPRQTVWTGSQAQVQAVAPRDLKACTQHSGGAGSCDQVWKAGITTNLKPILNYQHFFKVLKPCQSWSTCRKILMVTIDSLGWLKTVEWEIYNRPLKLEARIQQTEPFSHLQSCPALGEIRCFSVLPQLISRTQSCGVVLSLVRIHGWIQDF